MSRDDLLKISIAISFGKYANFSVNFCNAVEPMLGSRILECRLHVGTSYGEGKKLSTFLIFKIIQMIYMYSYGTSHMARHTGTSHCRKFWNLKVLCNDYDYAIRPYTCINLFCSKPVLNSPRTERTWRQKHAWILIRSRIVICVRLLSNFS